MVSDIFDLSGKIALITGSTRGIGRGIAELLHAQGAQIVVSSESAADTEAAAQAIGGFGIPCDVSSEASNKALVDQTVARFGGIDILVCNAGISGQLGDNSVEAFDRVIAINLRAQVALSNFALPHMLGRENASVILTSSLAGLRGNAALSAYALSKAGVAQLARNLAVQWGPKGIRTNAISPGMIATDMVQSALSNAAFFEHRMQMTPLRRPGTVAEVAGAVLFLASRAGGFVNGHNLVIDGGTVITDGS